MKRLWKILGIIVLAVAVILLIAPLLYPVAPLTGTVPERALADPDSRFVEVNGLTVHYKERDRVSRCLSFCMVLEPASIPGAK